MKKIKNTLNEGNDRIKINLNGKDVSKKTLANVKSGCRQTLKRLGELGNAIKVFEITFVRFHNYIAAGPLFKIRLRDPLGNKFFYVIDYRNIGTGSPNPTSEKIVDALCDKMALPYAIATHIEECAEIKKGEERDRIREIVEQGI